MGRASPNTMVHFNFCTFRQYLLHVFLCVYVLNRPVIPVVPSFISSPSVFSGSFVIQRLLRDGESPKQKVMKRKFVGNEENEVPVCCVLIVYTS